MSDADLADQEYTGALTIPGKPKELPASEEAEEGLLGACLIEGGDSFKRSIQAGITADSFFFPSTRKVFTKLVEMDGRGIPLTDATLIQEMGNDLPGGLPWLMQITSGIPTEAHTAYLIASVLEKSTKRTLIREAQILIEKAYNGTELPELAAQAEWAIRPLIERKTTGTGFTVWQPAAFRAYQPPLNANILGGGYLRRKQVTTLIGPPGVGKSRLSLWLACLHICGRQFAGLDMQNGPAKWLFFGNENDPLRQKTDLDWFYRSLTAPEQSKVDAHLFMHVIEKPDDGIIMLADADAFAKLCSTLKAVQPEVVVFDPWGNMIEGNENDNEEVRRTLRLLLRAIAANCPEASILVIHHARTGKATVAEAGNNYSGGNLSRGGKALVSAARCELALWPGDSEDSSKLVLTCEKANNVQKFEPKGLTFENGIYQPDDNFDLQAWRDDIEGNRGGKSLSIRDVVEMVKAGAHTTSEITAKADEQFGVQRRTVQTRLTEACEKGYLQRCPPAGSYTLGKAIPGG